MAAANQTAGQSRRSEGKRVAITDAAEALDIADGSEQVSMAVVAALTARLALDAFAGSPATVPEAADVDAILDSGVDAFLRAHR